MTPLFGDGRPWFWTLMGVAIALALAFRLVGLDARPMHHDEANQAIRFGQLLETGSYRYDAAEHHGPTLYYFTLPVAWARAQRTTASLDEWTVRLVPVIFGVATILLLIALIPGVGRTAVLVGAALMAVAPPLTYYSRFYIQESLLLFFSLGVLVMAGRYAWSGRSLDALWAGAMAGCAISTKETAVILVPAALAACIAARWWTGRPQVDHRAGAGVEAPRTAEHLWAAVAVTIGVAVLFYSSFLTDVSGLLEPFRAVNVYLARGLAPEAHRQPWYYYLGLLAQRPGGTIGGIDSALIIAALAAAKIAFRSEAPQATRFWVRTFLIYASVTTLVFSALPYKTPWNLLPFYGAWVVVVAVGAAEPLDRGPSRRGKVLLALALLAICASLGTQSWHANFRYPSDPRNPYAYVHTSPDVPRLAARVEAVAALHPDGVRMLVAVVAGPSEAWPLPWYFRKMPRVGYWTTMAEAGEALKTAPVVIASPEHAHAVEAVLGDRYESEFYGLRPNVILTAFIERSLWDRFVESVK